MKETRIIKRFGNFIFLITLLLTSSPVFPQLSNQDKGKQDISKTGETDLRRYPDLQQPVSLSVVERPLREVLKQIQMHAGQSSPGYSLFASRVVAEQRLTLSVRNMPRYQVMQRIAQLLSHSLIKQYYVWEKETSNGKTAFWLRQTPLGRKAEQDALSFPQRQGILLLREMHTLLRTPANERAKLQKEVPDKWIGNNLDATRLALQQMTDTELAELCKGNSLSLPLQPPDPETGLSFGKRTIRLTNGEEDNSAPFLWDSPGLSIIETAPDGRYSISTSFFDPYQSRSLTLPIPLEPAEGASEPEINLSTVLKEETESGSDLSKVLKALAKVAKINVFHEHFFGRATGPTPLPRTEQETGWWKGTPSELLLRICKRWHCRYEKVGDDYLFYYWTWAQYRQADIPEPFLERWRRRIKGRKPPTATLEDRIEVAGDLSWRQLRWTLPFTLTEVGAFDQEPEARMLQLLGALPPEIRQSAFAGQSVSLQTIPLRPDVRDGLRRLFPGIRDTLSENAVFLNAHLRMRTGETNEEGVLLNNRWEMRLMAGDRALAVQFITLPQQEEPKSHSQNRP